MSSRPSNVTARREHAVRRAAWCAAFLAIAVGCSPLPESPTAATPRATDESDASAIANAPKSAGRSAPVVTVGRSESKPDEPLARLCVRRFVRLVIESGDTMTFDGQAATRAELPRVFDATPHRERTVLEIAPTRELGAGELLGVLGIAEGIALPPFESVRLLKASSNNLADASPLVLAPMSGLQVRGPVFLGVDLAGAPGEWRSENLPDLWEERPPGSKSFEMRDDVAIWSGASHDDAPDDAVVRDFFSGEVLWTPRTRRFWIRHDPSGSSRMTYYGPFPGDPRKLLQLGEPSRPAKIDDADR